MAIDDEDGPTYAIAGYIVRPTRYRDLVHPDKHNWCVRVEDAGDGWAIRRGNMCLNFRNEWEHEPPPAARDEAFLRRSRFNEHAALLRARRVIDDLEFQNMTFAQFTAHVHDVLLAELLGESEGSESCAADDDVSNPPFGGYRHK